MKQQLKIYNSLSKKKENFEPVHSLHVGMYVCGPTVYGEPHLGHARPAIVFDIIFRFLRFLGYKVRYVRNITDVGHLEYDNDEGEDKIQKKARLEQTEPMEIAQHYTNRYIEFMNKLNVLPPSIEPKASGHIIEQIEMVQSIIDAGYAYEVNGSVYFDVKKYNEKYNYGKLSGRRLEDMLENTRKIEGKDEKKFPADFALWKKAPPEHIMQWKSPWSNGFPGWHLECSAMSCKYLGNHFDIHGGGMDLLFPHHEAEIAQSMVSIGNEPAKYWLHNNMISINNQKMSKSLDNFITLNEFFTGSHKLLEQAYEPMTIRFFILQSHYRNIIDFSNHALQSAEKAYKRLADAKKRLMLLNPADDDNSSENRITQLYNSFIDAMLDDFNTPIALAQIFETVKFINQAADGKIKLNKNETDMLKLIFNNLLTDVLGLNIELSEKTATESLSFKLISILLNIREQVKTDKNYTLADNIRDELTQAGIVIKDTKEGPVWEFS